MSADYYTRDNIVQLDGTRIFQTAEDRDHERAIASLIEVAWSCQIHHFGSLSPIDWFAVRDGRVVGVIELKARYHPSAKFSTVFLNVRKWLALRLAEAGLGVPAIFVVRFMDATKWILVRDVDASKFRIGGCARKVKSESDVEPIIEVPVGSMRSLDAPMLAGARA